MNGQEINLWQLLQQIKQARLYCGIASLMGIIIAILSLWVITPQYRAMMIVAPADGYALGDYASTLDNDQMANIPFWRPKEQDGASTDFYRFIHTVRGVSVAKILMQDQEVLKKLNHTVKRSIQTPEQLAEYIETHLDVDPLGLTPLRKLTYYHPDAEFSAAFLRKVHLVSDQMIRRDRRQQSQNRIDYLNNALAKTQNPEHRKIITNLLMQQEHIQMLANLDEPYSAIVVEPANTSSKPVWPNKTAIILTLAFVGFWLGFMFFSLRHRLVI